MRKSLLGEVSWLGLQSLPRVWQRRPLGHSSALRGRGLLVVARHSFDWTTLLVNRVLDAASLKLGKVHATVSLPIWDVKVGSARVRCQRVVAALVVPSVSLNVHDFFISEVSYLLAARGPQTRARLVNGLARAD